MRWILGACCLVLIGAGVYFGSGFIEKEEAATTPEAGTQNTATTTPEEPQGDPNDLLPDIVPLPARDVRLVTRPDGALMLLFSTTYYNQGLGNAELIADPAKKGIKSDHERAVLQRIYRKDGTYRDKEVGTFLWHQEHLHYHFSDFITYDLEAVDAPLSIDLSGQSVKATYCLRDVSRVDMPLENRKEEADYKICGKERQGISVGWADSYFYNFPGQALNISDLKTGTYRLTFIANPDNKLEEMRYQNNRSSIVFKLDMENKTVEVLERIPSQTPRIDHVHLEQPLGTGGYDTIAPSDVE